MTKGVAQIIIPTSGGEETDGCQCVLRPGDHLDTSLVISTVLHMPVQRENIGRVRACNRPVVSQRDHQPATDTVTLE